MRSFSFFIIASATAFLFSACGKNTSTNTPATAKEDAATVLYSEFHDFESVPDAFTDSTKAFSGKHSGALNQKTEYSFGLSKHFNQIASFKSIDEINVSFKCWMDKKYPDAVFVLSIDDSVSGKSIMWEGKPIVPSKMNDWDDVHINFKLNKKFILPNYTIKLYIWNKGKNTFYFDDLKLDFIKIKK